MILLQEGQVKTKGRPDGERQIYVWSTRLVTCVYKSHGEMLWLLEVPGISQVFHAESLPRESAACTLMSAMVTTVDLAGSRKQAPGQAVRDYLD